MDRKGWKGSVTVFFSLTCILFLCLICSIVESARVQGARAQTANIAGMGTFSFLGEFEPGLLEKYDIFAVDASYGTGSFKQATINERMEHFISCNANPKEGNLASLCFDPWNLELTDCSVSGYALLTDEKGEPFYQQAVAYMKANLGTAAVSKLLSYAKDTEELKEKQNEYETSKTKNDKEMSSLEEQKQQKLEQMESEAAAKKENSIAENNTGVSENGTAGNTAADNAIEILPAENSTVETSTDGNNASESSAVTNSSAENLIVENGSSEVIPDDLPENPLQEIAKLRGKSTLEIVTWDKTVSSKRIKKSGLPSFGGLKKGNYTIEKEYSGLTANVLFREYLLEYFQNYLEKESELALDYQVEYLLGGKTSDKDNLKYVVLRLLLLREGMNYLYCVNDLEMSGQAGSLATALTGFLGMPALTSATKHALLLAWAYAESLIDIRILLDGGKVPIEKDASSWNLELANLARITEILEQGAIGTGKGLEYRDYLRILLNMGSLQKQKIRALDLIQINLQKETDTKNFKAVNCIAAVKVNTEWNCKPVFLRLPQVIMGLSAKDIKIEQESSMTY